MKHETNGIPENLGLAERFDNLLDKLNSEDQTGWIELPGKWVKDPVSNRTVPVQFWIFNPKPLSGAYESAKYSPSIMLEIGRREFKDGTPVNTVEQVSLKREYFDEGEARYKNRYEDFLKALDKIELAARLYEESTFTYGPQK